MEQNPFTLIGDFLTGIWERLTFLEHPMVQLFFTIAQFGMGMLGLVFLAFIIFVLVRSSWIQLSAGESLAEFIHARPYGMKRWTKEWKKLKKRLDSSVEGEHKLAILEADQMLDQVLIKLQLEGSTTEERLRKAPDGMFPELYELQEARTARNNIIHDPDYALSRDEALRVMGVYEKVFSRLDLI